MSPTASITIQFNGQSLQVPESCTIVQLLDLVKIRSHLVAVEINLDIVPRSEHSQRTLQAGDIVEAVTLVGGG